jgi:hypothetical protein
MLHKLGSQLLLMQATEAAAAANAEQQQQTAGVQQQRPGTGSDPGQAQYAAGNFINLDSHLAAKAGRPTAGAGRKVGHEDDWGEEPLGDDLLPM